MLKLTITKNNKNKKETNMSSLTIKLNKADHQVDVDTYINTLRSLSVIAKEVNYKINGSANLSINVVAEKPGSFECVVEFVNTYGPLIATIAPEIINITQVLIELYKLKKKASEIDFSKTQAIDDHSVQLCNNVGNGVMVVNNNTYNIFTGNQSVQLNQSIPTSQEPAMATKLLELDTQAGLLFACARKFIQTLAILSSTLIAHSKLKRQDC